MAHIEDEIEEKARKDGSYAIAYAILQLARAQKDTATAIRNVDIAHLAERLDCGTEAIAAALREADS